MAHQPRIHPQPTHALGGGGHLLERGGEHGPHSDVAGAHGVGAHHFGITVGADSQAQAGAVQRLQFGGTQRVQVFLAQVNAVGACVNRHAPVVVDEQQRPCALHG